jgi:hypothetical protein
VRPSATCAVPGDASASASEKITTIIGAGHAQQPDLHAVNERVMYAQFRDGDSVRTGGVSDRCGFRREPGIGPGKSDSCPRQTDTRRKVENPAGQRHRAATDDGATNRWRGR